MDGEEKEVDGEQKGAKVQEQEEAGCVCHLPEPEPVFAGAGRAGACARGRVVGRSHGWV